MTGFYKNQLRCLLVLQVRLDRKLAVHDVLNSTEQFQVYINNYTQKSRLDSCVSFMTIQNVSVTLHVWRIF